MHWHSRLGGARPVVVGMNSFARIRIKVTFNGEIAFPPAGLNTKIEKLPVARCVFLLGN